MNGNEQLNSPHISENIAGLLVNELEPGNYSLKEHDVDVTIQIMNISDLGQHIVVHTVSSDENERVTIDIEVKHSRNKHLPDISAVSSRSRKDSKDISSLYWHTGLLDDSRDGRSRSNDIMPETYLVQIIEYVLNPNKQLIIKDL